MKQPLTLPPLGFRSFEALSVLMEDGGPVYSSELAEALGIGVENISGLMKPLLDRCLVKKEVYQEKNVRRAIYSLYMRDEP